MTMTIDEIVMEYKQAKAPMKQIGILADQNCCTKGEIAKILKEAGCAVPGQFDKKPKAEKAEAPEPEEEARACYFVEEIKAFALDVIAELIQADASDYVTEQIRGIFALIKHIEGRKQ